MINETDIRDMKPDLENIEDPKEIATYLNRASSMVFLHPGTKALEIILLHAEHLANEDGKTLVYNDDLV